MVDRVLIPTDGSNQADAACELAAEKFPDATLVLLHILSPAETNYEPEDSPSSQSEWYDQVRDRAERFLEETSERAAERGNEVESIVETGGVADVIVEVAARDDIDRIVMGSHSREGPARILLGSVAETVIRRSPVPVTVAK